jgi:hypothetical protein
MTKEAAISSGDNLRALSPSNRAVSADADSDALVIVVHPYNSPAAPVPIPDDLQSQLL